MKTRQERGAKRNEERTEDKRADHTPEQHTMLVDRLDSEVREDHSKHEQIVNRQCLLDQIACQKLKTALRPKLGVHHGVEHQSYGDPDNAPSQRLTRPHCVRLSVKHEKIEREQPDNANRKSRPHYWACNRTQDNARLRRST